MTQGFARPPVFDWGIVTALPTVGVRVGDTCILIAADESSGGVYWRFVYDGAGTYKWKFVGGPPLYHAMEGSSTTTSPTYQDLIAGGPGPYIYIPRAGDYIIAFGCQSEGSVATAIQYMSMRMGAVAATDADAIFVQPPGTNYLCAGQGRQLRKNGIAAATLVKAEYKTNAGTAVFSKRNMTVTPVRVI